MTLTKTSGAKARATKTSSSLFLRFTAVTTCEALMPVAGCRSRIADLTKRALREIRIPQSFFDDGVGLDLAEPVGVYEADDLRDRARGPRAAEELSVDARHRLPVLDAREQDARANHVREARAQAFECARDDLEA